MRKKKKRKHIFFTTFSLWKAQTKIIYRVNWEMLRFSLFILFFFYFLSLFHLICVHVVIYDLLWGFLPRWLSSKESACQCRRHRFDPWVGKIPWRRKWQPTPVCLPRKFHGQWSLTCYSPRAHRVGMTEHACTQWFTIKFRQVIYNNFQYQLSVSKAFSSPSHSYSTSSWNT